MLLFYLHYLFIYLFISNLSCQFQPFSLTEEYVSDLNIFVILGVMNGGSFIVMITVGKNWSNNCEYNLWKSSKFRWIELSVTQIGSSPWNTAFDNKIRFRTWQTLHKSSSGNPMVTGDTMVTGEWCYYGNWWCHDTVLDLSRGWGFNPPLVPLYLPSFHWAHQKIVKNIKNTLLTPLLFSPQIEYYHGNWWVVILW